MTAHRLTFADVTEIIEEKNTLVRENYQLRLMVENMKRSVEQYKKALRFNDNITCQFSHENLDDIDLGGES